jgi:SLA1 Homology Domain 1 (SHD1) protein
MWRPVGVGVIVALLCSVALSGEAPDEPKPKTQNAEESTKEQPEPKEQKAENSVKKQAEPEIEIDPTRLQSILKGKPLNLFRLKIGDIGKLQIDRVDSLQVVDIRGKDKMLAVPVRHKVKMGRRTASGVALKSSGTREERGETLMLEGWPTKRIVDGQELTNLGVVKVVGTKRVLSAEVGVITVLAIKRVDMAPLIEKERALKQKKRAQVEKREEEQKQAGNNRYEFRTWKDRTEKFSVEARFSSYGAGKVTLEKKDGAKVSLPLESLSKEDQEWVRGLKK